ncbi:MAG: hypothetical protein ACI8RP_002097 [Urechidicola sp.]|jgi:hypothetical protein
MPLKEFQKELKDHVSKDNLSETLEAIIKYSQNEADFSKIENSAIIVKAKLDRISREKINDEITSEDYHLGRNQVSEAILSLINEFDSSKPIKIPSPDQSDDTSQKDQIKDIIADNDKIFIKIILAALALSVSLFFFCIYYENYGGGGASLSSFSGAVYIYNNNKKQMLLSLQAAS